MRLLKSVLRPVYRRFFEKPLWWFLAKVKAFFLAEIGVQIEQMSQRLAVIEERLLRAEAIAEANNAALRAAEANNAAQWRSLEQLLLALLSQPDSRIDAEDSSAALPHELRASRQSGPD